MSWEAKVFSGAKYGGIGMVIDYAWWYAHLCYEDGMILVSGEGDTGVDAIIDAMRKLTYKAQISFAKFAHETRQLLPFYWIDNGTFVLNGVVYEITNCNEKVVIIRMEDFASVKFENLPFKPVNPERTNPPIKQVHDRLMEYQKTLDWENELLETKGE